MNGHEFAVKIDVGGNHDSTVKVGAPIADIATIMREHDVEPTPENLRVVLEYMQENQFNDKYGGCDASVVEDYIFETADLIVADMVDSGVFDDDPIQESKAPTSSGGTAE